jgi:hypothetical protein
MKQTKNRYFRFLFIAAMIFTLQSCLKNNDYYVDFSKGEPAVELPLAAKYTNKPFAVGLDVSNEPVTYYAVVNVASVDKPTSTVTATLALDKEYLDSYNAGKDAEAKQAQADYLAANPDNTVDDDDYPADYTPFELLPDSVYQIPSLEASIPAGTREDSLAIMIFTNKLEVVGHKYILPLTITNASTNISNWNHLMINVTAKNEWDGKYEAHIVISGNNSYTGTDFVDDGYVLSTVDLNSVYANDIGDWFGGYSRYIFNDDGTITVQAGGDVSDPNSYGAVVLDSHYDKSDHSFYVKYNFLGGKYIFEQTMVKK